MKARGKRWEGKKSEREPYPPNATYLQSSSEIRRHLEAPAFSFLPSLLLLLFLLEYPAGSSAEERATKGLVSCWVSEWPRHSLFNKKASFNYFSQLGKKYIDNIFNITKTFILKYCG